MATSPAIGQAPAPYSPTYNTYYPVEYFAGVDTSIFFGEEYIDEIIQLEYGLYETIFPIYSYASYTPNTIVHGSRLVRGSFEINARPGNYLHDFLSTDLQAQATALTQNTSAFSLTNIPGSLFPQPDPSTDPAGFATWAANQKQNVWGTVNSLINVHNISASTQPYFTNNNFTIMLIWGDLDSVDLTRNVGRIRTIENVNIYNVHQVIELSGENIKERYLFMGNDINQTVREQGITSSTSSQATSQYNPVGGFSATTGASPGSS